MTTIRSPPSTDAVCDTATLVTIPALGAVMAASIFIASIVAIVWPAATVLANCHVHHQEPAPGAVATIWSTDR